MVGFLLVCIFGLLYNDFAVFSDCLLEFCSASNFFLPLLCEEQCLGCQSRLLDHEDEKSSFNPSSLI